MDSDSPIVFTRNPLIEELQVEQYKTYRQSYHYAGIGSGTDKRA